MRVATNFLVWGLGWKSPKTFYIILIGKHGEGRRRKRKGDYRGEPCWC
jgi:hypothetical protein